ncbi:DEAD/DEAH box helicase [Micromonospora sp. LOL_023]|uniref:DEAD/DEAH box helicase n=1 Tax=Micromonospora sp. LOL_023 TaxID=3345418 RepID=UPI003A83617A
MSSPMVAAALRALAELAPAAPERMLDVTRGGQPLLWLADPERHQRDAATDRLAAVDLLHRDERILRRGLGLVVGTVERDGVRRRVRLPLLSEPVRLERGLRGYRVVSAGELELTSLVTDRAVAASLESVPGLGGPGWLTATGTQAWLRTAAAAAGLPLTEVRPAPTGRRPRPPASGLTGYLAAVLFTVRDVYGVALADGLRAWAGRDLTGTALAEVYQPTPTGTDGGAGETVAGEAATPGVRFVADAVESPLPLTAAQSDVVRRVRRERLTVVSGPPGNGKSHAVVAAALDTVDRGGSVLVVTQSPHAADVLVDLLARYRGPTPVLFGDAQRRAEVAATLAAGAGSGVPAVWVSAAEDAVAVVRSRVARETGLIRLALETERLAAAATGWEPLLGALSLTAPGAFVPGADLAGAARAVRLARTPGGGNWWTRWRRRAARRWLRRRLGVAVDLAGDTDGALDQVAAAVEAARAVAARARLAAVGGTDLAACWDRLDEADRELAERVGTAMRNRVGSERRWDPPARRNAGALASALRAGRNRRRELLTALDGPALVRALPLWIGTVTDVAELLPPSPGLFDLVILDEASHSDQIRAAPALARARRALVVGDPRQLRFVSFVADVDVADTLDRHGLDDRLDVRRVSAFDLAAASAPVTWLDEHFRCVPQLIEFSARRFYADRFAVTTRHPANESIDVIAVRQVVSAATVDGVNQAEVAATVEVVRELATSGQSQINVVTPFRAQADALEAALVAEFPVERIEELRLRVGTVHAIQGGEAETVVASFAVTDDDPSARLRFLADPHLFNVLITRARRQLVVVTSLSAADGLVGEFLRYARQPPPAVPARGAVTTAGVSGWAEQLGARLTELGGAVRFDYPVGRWTVDICLGAGADAVGLNCVVHPEGPQAHLARQRALRRAGWALADAFASRWNGDPVRAALEILAG